MECPSYVETKEVQVVSPQLPQQKLEILNVENFPQVHQVVKSSGSVSTLPSELGEANKQSVHFKHNSRVSNLIPVRTITGCVSACGSSEFRTNNFSRSGNTRNAKKGAIKPAHSSENQFLSPIFFVPKKVSEQRQ